jgi:hypothetical protein
MMVVGTALTQEELVISARINTGIILAMPVTGSWGWKV